MRKMMTLGLAALTLASAGAAAAQPRPYGDRDRDGVPNAADPYNNNQGRPLGDRDRDGVPNAYDGRDDRWDNRWGAPVRAPQYWGNNGGVSATQYSVTTLRSMGAVVCGDGTCP